MASPTTNKGFQYPAHGGAVGAWDTPLNQNFEYQDLILGGYYSITASSSITVANTFNSTFATIASTARSVTLPTSIAQNLFYNVLGTLQSSLVINMPAAGSIYVFGNGITTGSSCEIVTGPAGGSTITLPSNGRTVAVFNSSAAYYAQNVFDAIAVSSGITGQSVSAQTIAASSAITGQSIAVSSNANVSGALAVTGDMSAASVSGTVVATQAIMEAAAATDLVVTPGLQKFHPSAAKAWVNFAGASGVIQGSYGVSGVSRSGTGTYTISFSTDFSNSGYVIMMTAFRAIAAPQDIFCVVTSQSTHQFTCKTFDVSANVQDCLRVYAACLGDLT